MNNKFVLALAAGLMSIGLVGCNNQPEPQPTPEGQQDALNRAKEASIASTTDGPILDTRYQEDATLVGYGNSLSLLKQYTYYNRKEGVEYVVKIKWTYDEEKYGRPNPDAARADYAKDDEGKEIPNTLAIVKKWETDNTDDTKYYGALQYSTVNHLFEFACTLTIGELSDTLNYKISLTGREMEHVPMTHEEFYEVAQNDDGLPYFKNWMQSSAEKIGSTMGKYVYDHGTLLTIKGKITYVSPDKNFAYLQDGDRILSLYHPEWSGDAAMFVLGKYLETNVYISSYYGAPQVANMEDTKEFANAEALGITEPNVTPITVVGKNLTGEFKNTPDRFNQFSSYHYRLVSLTGKFKKSSLPSTASVAGRFKFTVVAADGSEVTVAYNYHTQFSEAWLNKLKGLADNANITVVGSLTYAAKAEKAPNSFNPANTGEWNIVPIDEASSIVTA